MCGWHRKLRRCIYHPGKHPRHFNGERNKQPWISSELCEKQNKKKTLPLSGVNPIRRCSRFFVSDEWRAHPHAHAAVEQVWMSLRREPVQVCGAHSSLKSLTQELLCLKGRVRGQEEERRCDWMHLNTDIRTAWKTQNVLQRGASVFPSIHCKWKSPKEEKNIHHFYNQSCESPFSLRH